MTVESPFGAGEIPLRFERRVVTISPGGERAYDEAEWRDSIVVIARGEVDLVCDQGGTRRFGDGDIVYLVGIPLRTLRNAGVEPVLLVAVSRRAEPVEDP